MFETDDEYTRRIAKENVHRLNANLRRDEAERQRAAKADKRDFRFEMLGAAVSATAWGIGKFRNRQATRPAPATQAQYSRQAAQEAAPQPQPPQEAAGEAQPALFELDEPQGAQPLLSPQPGAQHPTEKLAIIGFVLSLVGFFIPLLALGGIVVSALGLRNIQAAAGSNREVSGRGLALAGLIIGAVALGLWLLVQVASHLFATFP